MPENPFFGAFLHQPYAQFGYGGPLSDVVYNPSYETTTGVGFQRCRGPNGGGFKLNCFGDNSLQIDTPGGIQRGAGDLGESQYGEMVYRTLDCPGVFWGNLCGDIVDCDTDSWIAAGGCHTDRSHGVSFSPDPPCLSGL